MEQTLPVSPTAKNVNERYLTLPLDPQGATWTCPKCGTIRPFRLTFGGSTRYARRLCACQEQVAQERDRAILKAEQQRVYLETQANHMYTWMGRRWSDPSLREKTFKMFDASRQPKAFEAATLFVEDMSGTLVFYGGFGTGKTHLLASIGNAALQQRNIAGRFTSAPLLFRAIQARMQEDQGYDDLIEKAIKTPLLMIDDIDKAPHSSFRESTYFTIIDERVKAGRPNAISTNRLDELDAYVGGAVCSRLKIGQIPVKMVGDDYREEL